jgi:monoamine oxidase
MAHSALFGRLQSAVGVAAAGSGLTRRELLQRAAAVGAAVRMPGLLRMARPASGGAPRIAVVGAGLAGLTCAYRLKQAGLAATVYEASSRLGGRCWTLRDQFDEGQIAEHGGELIDQDHTAIRHLARELGLTLDNLHQAEPNGAEPFYYFSGARYSHSQACSDLTDIWQTLHGDVTAAGYPTLYTGYTRRGWELDHMSIADWIDASVPGGLASPLGKLLDVAYNIEFGAESGEQSALNLLYLLGYCGPGRLRMFGKSDEKYHVNGGNDQIVARLAAALSGQIETGWALSALRLNSSGSYTLTLDSGPASRDVVADQVVLAIPFSIMRAAVDTSRAGFSAVKQQAIAELGMGTNTKLNVQFSRRAWVAAGCTGETYTDTGYQNTWEVSRAQTGTAGILVDFTGGQVGASFSRGSAATRAAEFLQQMEPVLPGITGAWNGKAAVDYWPGYRWTRGSYAFYKVGQYTAFAGAEGTAEGNCHFCGEHTSYDYQGYLNGAVDTGERVATEITHALGARLLSK